MHLATPKPHSGSYRARLRALAVALLPLSLLLLQACAPPVAAQVDTETRSFSHTIAIEDGQPVRLANLAGRVELVAADGRDVVIDAVVHANGGSPAKTQELLENMAWEEHTGSDGEPEWVLTYPVKDHDRLHYNADEWGAGHWGMMSSTTVYAGRRVKLSTANKGGSIPTVYANLRIQVPLGVVFRLENTVGLIDGRGTLGGDWTLDTGSGAVSLEEFAGQLLIDTGSGDVTLGTVRGETNVDTGSGDVEVAELIGNGRLDTGSGDVRVRKVASGRLVVDTGSGDVYLADGSAGRLELDTGSGEIRVIGVEVEEVLADTGSGDIVVESSLAGARRLDLDTGSGDVRILGGSDASFEVELDSGSGELVVRYDDADLVRSDRKVVGARRGSGQPRIVIDTGSGDALVAPGD